MSKRHRRKSRSTQGTRGEVGTNLRSSLFPSWRELNSAIKQKEKVANQQRFLTRSHPRSSLPALCGFSSLHHATGVRGSLSSATMQTPCWLNFPLYVSQQLRDANVLFTEFRASAVDVIANLFDRQLGNELMMAFRPALRLNRHASAHLPDSLTFKARVSSYSVLWPQRGRQEEKAQTELKIKAQWVWMTFPVHDLLASIFPKGPS